MSGYFLGVDGGQSSTVAMIGDSKGKIRGWATAGPCNHVGAAEARAKFVRVMRECLSQAARQAGINPEKPSFSAACLGMSGGPEDKAALLAEVIDSGNIIVTHDGQIALAGATGGEPGIIVIAGTGSIAFGENLQRETARAGGWGYIFGDEGGGFGIAREALRAALREHEGWGPRTALTPALIESAGASNPNEALHLFYTPEWPRSRVATLAKTVSDIAETGDPVAIGILNNAAQHLAMLAAGVRRQLWRDEEPVKVSWIGGAFNSLRLQERFRTLVQLEGSVTAGPPAHSPVVGALILAWRSAGLTMAPEAAPVTKT